MKIKTTYGYMDAFNSDTFSNCCGATYYNNKQQFRYITNNQTNCGITLYEGNDLEESNEENGKYICSKVETKNGTFFVKVRTRWL
jgi:hypothetical protein